MQAPFYIATKLTRIEKSNLLTPTPEPWSKASIRWIGYDDICVPYWPHHAISSLSKIIPSSFMNWLQMKLHLDLRDFYMNKYGDDDDDLVEDLDAKKSR